MSLAPLQYSTQASASASVPVPMFRQMYGSVPSSAQYSRNSSVPNRLLSTPPQASSGRLGLPSLGPIPSAQW